MSVLCNELRKSGITPVGYVPVKSDVLGILQRLRSTDFDAVVVNGEGSIHDTYGNLYAASLCQVATFANAYLKKPCYLINASVHNVANRHIENLRDFTRIWVRETQSRAVLEQYGICANVVPDLSFFHEDGASETMHDPRYFVTDSVSGIRSRQLERLAVAWNVPVWPLKVNNEKTLRRRVFCRLRSYKPQRRIRFRLSSIKKTEQHLVKVCEAMRVANVTVTGRFHAATLAISRQRPVLAVESNTPKIGALLHDVFASEERKVNDIDELLHEPPEVCSERVAYTGWESERIRAYKDDGRRAMTKMFADLAEDATST